MELEKERLLAELLEEVVQKEGSYLPEKAYFLIHRLVCWGAVEVLITRNEGKEFLLRYREDKWFRGWHIPGGYIKPTESIQEACNRMAQEDAGVDSVNGLKLVAVMKWSDHPFSAPLCLLLTCEPNEKVVERNDLKFFSDVPEPMIHRNHILYLQTYLEYLRSQEGFTPVILA